MKQTPTPLTMNREQYGAAIRLTISGQPPEVATTVNQFYNHGIVSNIPDTYSEEDYQVTLLSDRKRLIKGLVGIAHNNLKRSARFHRCAVPAILPLFHAARELVKFRRLSGNFVAGEAVSPFHVGKTH